MKENVVKDESMKSVVGGAQFSINKKRCIACEMCVITCPVQAISISNNCASINNNLCTLCGKCANACPTGAIDKQEVTPTR